MSNKEQREEYRLKGLVQSSLEQDFEQLLRTEQVPTPSRVSKNIKAVFCAQTGLLPDEVAVDIDAEGNIEITAKPKAPADFATMEVSYGAGAEAHNDCSAMFDVIKAQFCELYGLSADEVAVSTDQGGIIVVSGEPRTSGGREVLWRFRPKSREEAELKEALAQMVELATEQLATTRDL